MSRNPNLDDFRHTKKNTPADNCERVLPHAGNPLKATLCTAPETILFA